MARKSKWSFVTSGGASGGGVGLTGSPFSVGAEVQSFTLKDPNGIQSVFTYEAVNVSVSATSKNSPSKGVVGSTEDMGSNGGVWMVDGFAGQELSASDFEGICMFGETTISAKAVAFSAVVMWLGCPATKIVTELANSPIGFGVSGLLFPFLGPWGKVSDYVLQEIDVLPDSVFQQGAKAMLIMGGQAVSNQVTASLGGGYGLVQRVSTATAPPPPTPQPPGPRRFKENVRDLIHLPSDFLFAFDHSDIEPSVRVAGALLEVAGRIRAKSPARLEIVGYTDSIGDAGYNVTLSKARAETIAQILVGFGLVERKQITTTGYGALYPVASNATDDGRAHNRRVEIRVY